MSSSDDAFDRYRTLRQFFEIATQLRRQYQRSIRRLRELKFVSFVFIAQVALAHTYHLCCLLQGVGQSFNAFVVHFSSPSLNEGFS
jgi:hypothetical protein